MSINLEVAKKEKNKLLNLFALKENVVQKN